MSSRTRTSRASTGGSSLAMTKAVQAITKQRDGFMKAVEKCDELIAETFADLEMKIEAKTKELDELETKFTHDEQNRKVELDLSIKEHGYEAALNILAKREEVAVPSDVYEKLKADFAELQASKTSDLNAALDVERKRNAETLAAHKRTMELQKQAEVARVEAQLETQVKQIELLQQTIENLKFDIQAQRELTKNIAESANKSMPMYLPQSSK